MAKQNEMFEIMSKQAELLKGLAHPLRLCIAKKLYEKKKCNVTEFVDCMQASQSNISQHLSKMKSIGILESEKDGQNVYYYLKDSEVSKILKAIFKN